MPRARKTKRYIFVSAVSTLQSPNTESVEVVVNLFKRDGSVEAFSMTKAAAQECFELGLKQLAEPRCYVEVEVDAKGNSIGLLTFPHDQAAGS